MGLSMNLIITILSWILGPWRVDRILNRHEWKKPYSPSVLTSSDLFLKQFYVDNSKFPTQCNESTTNHDYLYPNVESDSRSTIYGDNSCDKCSISVGNELEAPDFNDTSDEEEIEEWNNLIIAYENDEFEKELWDAGMFGLYLC